MSEKPEGNGPPPPLPEIPARLPTPAEATTHTTPLSNGVRLSTVLPTPPPRIGSAMPLVQAAGAPPPPPPPPPPPSDMPTVKIEPSTCSESPETEFQHNQKRELCRDFIRGRCSRESKCRHLHEIDKKQDITFCHDFQNKECNRPGCKYVHATITEQQNFFKTDKLPKAILERNRNGKAQSCNQPISSLTTIADLNNLITRPPPPPSTINRVSGNLPTHFNQGPPDVFPPPANLSRPPPTVPKWNCIQSNGRPTIPPPPPTENFTQPPAHNLPPMSYFPPTNQPPPTAVMKDNGWPTPTQQLPMKTDIHATDRNIGIKRMWPDTGENLNVSQSVSPGHKAMRMDFMGSCTNCKLLESRLATANREIEKLLKIIAEFEKWKKEAEKQKSLLEHISSIIGNSQTQNQTPSGDNVPSISNTLLNLGLPVASLCTQMPMQSALDSQQITMQLPSLQLPQILQLQRNHTSNDQQVRMNNPPSMIGNSQNWPDTNLTGQQSMVSMSYGNNQVMLHMPPGRQLTPQQQQQVLQLLDSSGFSISYK